MSTVSSLSRKITDVSYLVMKLTFLTQLLNTTMLDSTHIFKISLACLLCKVNIPYFFNLSISIFSIS